MTIDAASGLSPKILAAVKRELSRRNSIAGKVCASRMTKRQLADRAAKANKAAVKAKEKCKHIGTDRYVFRAGKRVVVTAASPALPGETECCRYCTRKV